MPTLPNSCFPLAIVPRAPLGPHQTRCQGPLPVPVLGPGMCLQALASSLPLFWSSLSANGFPPHEFFTLTYEYTDLDEAFMCVLLLILKITITVS